MQTADTLISGLHRSRQQHVFSSLAVRREARRAQSELVLTRALHAPGPSVSRAEPETDAMETLRSELGEQQKAYAQAELRAAELESARDDVEKRLAELVEQQGGSPPSAALEGELAKAQQEEQQTRALLADAEQNALAAREEAAALRRQLEVQQSAQVVLEEKARLSAERAEEHSRELEGVRCNLAETQRARDQVAHALQTVPDRARG